MHVTNSSRQAGRLFVLALLGIFGQAFFVVAVVVLPFFNSGYSSVDDPISRLLLGPYGLVLSVALFSAGLGALALAISIHRMTRGARGSLLGPVLIGLWGIGFALAGVVFTDAEGNVTEIARVLHGAAVGLAFISAPTGILLLSGVFARDRRWSPFYPPSLALGFGALVALTNFVTVSVGLASLTEVVGPVARSFEGLGIMQRLFVGTVVLWMILASARLCSIAKSGHSTTPSV